MLVSVDAYVGKWVENKIKEKLKIEQNVYNISIDNIHNISTKISNKSSNNSSNKSRSGSNEKNNQQNTSIHK